jgi:DNA-binding CsgD family transcriptional regulator
MITLTKRQTEVLLRIVAGQSNAEIGRALFIDTKSVKAHATVIYRACGMRSRSRLIAAYYRGELAGIEPSHRKEHTLLWADQMSGIALIRLHTDRALPRGDTT